MSDLDSFFAKKDKKKLKGKKFTTTDEIAQRLVDTEKKTEKTIQASSSKFTAVPEPIKKPEEAPVAPTPEQPTPEVEKTTNPPVVETAPVEPKVEEDLWNDFKDDDTVDVSNLRITKLNIEEEEDGRGGIDGNEDCRDSSGEDKKKGVWEIEEQKSFQASINEQVEMVLDNGMEDVKARVAAMSNNSRWTSSIQRDMQPSPLPRGSQPGARRKKVAPDITNAAAFPSLADAKASGSRRKAQDEREGGEVRGGGGPGTPSGGSGGSGARNLLAAREASSGSSGGAYRPPQLRTNNRFGALSDHGSLRHQS